MAILKPNVATIPMKFAKSNGLSNRNCQMIIRDEMQRSWPVKLMYNSSRVHVGLGWRNFRITNGLKEGDEFMLELIEDGHKPVMNFRKLLPMSVLEGLDQKNKQGKTPQNAAKTEFKEEETTSAHGCYPHFFATLRSYSFKRSLLVIVVML